MPKKIYEVIKGREIIVEKTGKKDETCPKASFTRWEYKVIDYGDIDMRWPNDLIYLGPHEKSLLREVQDVTKNGHTVEA